ncbi:MAG: hypothetical protein IPI79_09645 [Moraxellaceae bacterium]|nr:hypothetical protein [Moraxellaceae bacterium]
MGRLTVIKSILAIMVCWGWIGIAYALDLTAQEEAWLAAHPVIRVGIDPAWRPMSLLINKASIVALVPTIWH